MGFGRRVLSALGKVGILVAVLVAFVFGMLGTVYLSLRTSEVKVPDVLGKDRFSAESVLDDAGLKLRVRGARPSAEKPDTVLSQLPQAGEIVKAGIPVAVEVSRAPKEGESAPSSTEAPAQEAEKPADEATKPSTDTNQNQNKPPKNKNTNKNANSNTANISNANRAANANRNANNRNTNTGPVPGNRNANTLPIPNANRNTENTNSGRRPPAVTTPPFNPGANTRQP